MGGNLLANMVGHLENQCFLDAACIVAAPIKMWLAAKAIEKNLFGIYNKHLGKNLNKVLIEHEKVLQPLFSAKLDMKISRRVKEPPNLLKFDNDITAPIFGWKDRIDYYNKASCYHRIPMIKIPTLFLNA